MFVSLNSFSPKESIASRTWVLQSGDRTKNRMYCWCAITEIKKIRRCIYLRPTCDKELAVDDFCSVSGFERLLNGCNIAVKAPKYCGYCAGKRLHRIVPSDGLCSGLTGSDFERQSRQNVCVIIIEWVGEGDGNREGEREKKRKRKRINEIGE